MTIAEHTRLTKLQKQWAFLYQRQFVSPYLMDKFLKVKKRFEAAKTLIMDKYKGEQGEIWK